MRSPSAYSRNSPRSRFAQNGMTNCFRCPKWISLCKRKAMYVSPLSKLLLSIKRFWVLTLFWPPILNGCSRAAHMLLLLAQQSTSHWHERLWIVIGAKRLYRGYRMGFLYMQILHYNNDFEIDKMCLRNWCALGKQLHLCIPSEKQFGNWNTYTNPFFP